MKTTLCIYVQQIRETSAQFQSETKFVMGWFMLVMKIILVFHPIGRERSLVFGVMNLEHVKIIVTHESCIVAVPYLTSAKKSVEMQGMFKLIVFKDSD